MSRRPDSDVEEEDALSNSDDGGSSLASDGAATSGDPKKVSKGARAMHSLRNLLRSKSAKDAEKKKIAQARLESAKTSGDATPNGVIGASSSPPPLRSTASSSGLLSPGIRIEAPNASSASPEADSEPESVSPSSASSSGGSSLAPSASRRSVYAQKLIHFSNSFRSLFLPSIGANGQTGPGRNGVTGFSSHPHHFTNSPAWILGKVYKLLGDQQQAQIAAAAAAGAPSASVSASSAALLTRRRRFLSDYHTRVWMTYRRGFQNIGSSSYASDAGWGCMIRSAQMMLAHMLITHYLGREWRKPEREDDVSDLEGAPVNVEAEPAGGAASLSKNRSCDVSFAGRSPSPSPSPRPEAPLPPLPAAYLRILYLFLDSPSPACPYSIHNLLLVGGAAGSSASASASATAAKGKGSSASSTAASSSAAGFASRIGEWFGPHNACWMMKQTMEAELSRVREKIKIGRKTKFGAGDDEEDEAVGAAETGSNSSHSSKAGSRRSSASAASAIPPIYSVPKIYVSDDGTLYLDKIMQLATGEQQQQREEEAAKAAAIAAAQRRQQPMPEGAVTEHPLARPPLTSPPPAVPAASMDDSAAVASPADSSASPIAAAASPGSNPSASPPSASASAASALSHLAAAYAATSSGSSLPAASIPCPPHFTPDFHPLLILIPLRLGVDKLNPSYIPSLLSLFQFPACVGIIGGKPRSSLYFIGVQDAMLFYLDPHTVQKSASLVGESSLARGSSLAAKHAIASSYHCSSIQSIPVRDIDPSMALGFYIENRKSLEHFWEQAKQFSQPATLAAQAAGTLGLDIGSSSSSSSMPLYPVFHVAEVSPQYSFDDSDDDEDEDEEGDESDGVDGLGDASASGSGSELDEFPDAQEEDEAGGEFAKARAAMPPWPVAMVGQPQEREMTIFKRMSIDADGDAEDAAEAKRDEEAARRSESPTVVNAGSLPKDAAGRPLNMDSLTSSPVLCPQGAQPTPIGGSPGNSLAASDSMEFNLGPTAESAAASADSAEPSGAVASLSNLTYAALGSFSSFTAAVASTATQQLAAAQQHIANGAASLHAQASALRKGSSEGPSAPDAAAAAEEAAVTAALVAAYSAPVPASSAADSASSSAAAAAPSPASAAPATSSSAVSPAAAGTAASTTPASAPVRRVKSKSKRKSSKAAANAATAGSDGDEEWSIL